MTLSSFAPESAVEPRTRPRRPRLFGPIDVTDAMTVYLVLLFAVPSALVFGPLGAAAPRPT